MSNTKFLSKKLNDNPELREAFLEAYEKLVQVVDQMEQEEFEREEKEKLDEAFEDLHIKLKDDSNG